MYQQKTLAYRISDAIAAALAFAAGAALLAPIALVVLVPFAG